MAAGTARGIPTLFRSPAKRRSWTLLAILAVALGSLLGLAASFRSHPYPAFLPIVVGGIRQPGAVAFADADLTALAQGGFVRPDDR